MISSRASGVTSSTRQRVGAQAQASPRMYRLRISARVEVTGAGAQAFGARVDRPWQAGEGGNRAVQFRRLSVHRHDLASCR
ncbi:hypothetical protein RLJV_23555 [Pseudomonas aeruginosa]|nr:hypothetical protein RLJV_23555 [Pseudomonas aeruginosa]